MLAAIELKGGRNIAIDRIVAQIQGGLNILDRVAQSQDVNDVLPILLYAGRRDPTSALSDKRVNFRGVKRRIIPKPCGSRLDDIVKESIPGSRRRTNRRHH